MSKGETVTQRALNIQKSGPLHVVLKPEVRIPSALSASRRQALKEDRALVDAKKAIKEQRFYFSNDQIEALEFRNNDKSNIFLKPDLSSLKPTTVAEIGRGIGFTVFQVDDKKVLKVEQVVVRKDPETGAMSTHYPWMSIGMDRHALNSTDDVIERRKIHLENKIRLESVGIKTANYIGSMVVPSLPTGEVIEASTPEQKEVDSQKEANRRMERDRVRGTPAMYAEVWENVKGTSLERNERAVNQLYKTLEGRNALKQLAFSLLELSKQGFVCDVDQNYHGVASMAKTKKENPFPRNFFIRKRADKKSNELVAYDFNVGIDLTKELWWKKEFEKAEPLMRSKMDGKIYASYDLQKSMQEQVRNMFFRPKFNVLMDLEKQDYDRLHRLEEERVVFESQIEKLTAQKYVSAAILAKIEEITGEKQEVI